MRQKRTEYGDSASMSLLLPQIRKGIKTDGKINVELNDKAIEMQRELAGYNLMVTSKPICHLKIYALP